MTDEDYKGTIKCRLCPARIRITEPSGLCLECSTGLRKRHDARRKRWSETEDQERRREGRNDTRRVRDAIASTAEALAALKRNRGIEADPADFMDEAREMVLANNPRSKSYTQAEARAAAEARRKAKAGGA